MIKPRGRVVEAMDRLCAMWQRVKRMDGRIKELVIESAITEARLLLDEMRERQRSAMLLQDHYVEEIRACHAEARRILSEVTEDRRRFPRHPRED